jgi:hypothetical protein
MGKMEMEPDILGVEAGSLNERIVKLRLNSGTRKVASFKEPRHDISPLNGVSTSVVVSATKLAVAL